MNWSIVIIVGVLLTYLLVEFGLYISAKRWRKYRALPRDAEGQQLADFNTWSEEPEGQPQQRASNPISHGNINDNNDTISNEAQSDYEDSALLGSQSDRRSFA